MDFSIVTDFLQGLIQDAPAFAQGLAARDPMELLYAAAGLLSATLLFLFVLRGRRRRTAAQATGAHATPAKASRKAKRQAAQVQAPELTVAEDEALPAPPTPVRPQRAASLKLATSDGDVHVSAPKPTPLSLYAVPAPGDLSDLGFYTPHFDLGDSDAFRDAIKDVRADQTEIATTAGIILAIDDGADADPAAIAAERLAARAFTADCDAAIATVRWNSIEQMEERMEKTQANVDATLALHGRQVNPAYADLKLKELRLTHEHREKLKEEKDLRAELARLKKEEAQLVKDAKIAEKGKVQLQSLFDKAKQAAQKATGEEAFELEARVGDLARQLEEAHRLTERAQSMIEISTAGHLYVASNVGAFGEGVFKIGVTRRPDPDSFVEDLAHDSVPFPFDVHAMVYSEDTEALREKVYAAFEGNRMNRTGPNNGFFTLSLDDITAVLSVEAPDAAFTSPAEAQGYHQTLAQLRQAESGAA
ncbi:MAG: hypothetical protein ACI95S_000283 [Dinoroseobacter sp.]|jgi:hypothetical protein